MSFAGGYQSEVNVAQYVFDATENVKGISEIATIGEVNTGTDDSRTVSPLKLAAYIADKITGLWKDKGTYNAVTSPNYPPAKKGDAYTITTTGKVGGTAGIMVEIGDVMYCRGDNPGGDQANVGSFWNVIQGNVVQASETVTGLMRFCSPTEVTNGVNDLSAVTPAKLASVLKYAKGAGTNSIIPKLGTGNTAPGSHGLVMNGISNRANGTYSVAAGGFADAFQHGEFAKAPGAFFNVAGSAQSSTLHLWGSIAGGSGANAISVDAAGTKWKVPDNSICQFMLQCNIVQNSGLVGTPGTAWTAIYEGVVKNVAGTVTWMGAGAPTARDVRQDAGFSPVVSFTLASGEITPSVNAMTDRNLHVNMTAYITQTKFSLS